MKNYYIFFYVPKDNCELVKEAMFKAGAGRLGDYEACAWQTEGLGQFRPNNGSNPYIGEIGKLEKVEEIKVEMFCKGESLKDAIKALKDSHPYEEVAYGVFELVDF